MRFLEPGTLEAGRPGCLCLGSARRRAKRQTGLVVDLVVDLVVGLVVGLAWAPPSLASLRALKLSSACPSRPSPDKKAWGQADRAYILGTGPGGDTVGTCSRRLNRVPRRPLAAFG